MTEPSTPDTAATVHPGGVAACSCRACRYRRIRSLTVAPAYPERTRVQYEVWGDGEDLRHGIDTLDKAIDYAVNLGPDWRCIEIVTVRRTVNRVR